MAGMYAVQAVNAYSTGQNEARAIRGKAAYDSMMARSNERLSLMNADDATKRGDLAAGKVRRDASRTLGAQKVNAAAQGLDINSGSAADLQAETQNMSEADINTIKNNAWREAWGYRVQANNYEGQARMTEIGGKYGAKATALTGGIQAAGYIAQGGYAYQKGQNTEDILGKMGKVTQLPADNNDDPAAKTRDIASVGKDGKTDNERSQDQTAGDLKKSSYGKDWREEKYGANFRDRYRSRTNPFTGEQMTSSWWINYDDGETA